MHLLFKIKHVSINEAVKIVVCPWQDTFIMDQIVS